MANQEHTWEVTHVKPGQLQGTEDIFVRCTHCGANFGGEIEGEVVRSWHHSSDPEITAAMERYTEDKSDPDAQMYANQLLDAYRRAKGQG